MYSYSNNETDRRFSYASSVHSFKRNQSQSSLISSKDTRRLSTVRGMKRPLQQVKQNYELNGIADTECEKLSAESQSGDSIPESASKMIPDTKKIPENYNTEIGLVCLIVYFQKQKNKYQVQHLVLKGFFFVLAKSFMLF